MKLYDLINMYRNLRVFIWRKYTARRFKKLDRFIAELDKKMVQNMGDNIRLNGGVTVEQAATNLSRNIGQDLFKLDK